MGGRTEPHAARAPAVGGMSRRAFVRAGATTAGLLALGGRIPPAAAQSPAARILHKGVALGPAATMHPDAGSARYAFAANAPFFDATHTRYTRLWAHWPTLQPVWDGPPGVTPLGHLVPAGRRHPADALAALDAGIRAANTNSGGPVHVILTADGTPTWASPQTRAAFAALRGRRSDESAFPDTVDPASPWAAWIAFLLTRYAGPATPPDLRIEALEIANEPNYLAWPATSPVAPQRVAQMIATATAVADALGRRCALTGPGAADTDPDPPRWMGYRDFTREVAALLRERGWRDPRWAWSHHNYTDVMRDQGPGTRAPDRRTADRGVMRVSHVVADLATAGWAGARSPEGPPAVWITEGGCHRPSLDRRWGRGATALWTAGASADHRQAVLLRRNHERLAGPEGAGVGLHMNYLFTSEPPTGFDSGLCDERGVPRAEPIATWAAFPA